MKFFLIICSVNILLILVSCAKKSQQEQEHETNSISFQKTKSYRERLVDNFELKTKNSSNILTKDSSNNKSISAKTVKEKLNNLEIYTTNDLLSSEEINLLSDNDKIEYIKTLFKRISHRTEDISLHIYEYIQKNNLFALYDRGRPFLLQIVAGYANNQGKGFDKIYELYDSFINEQHSDIIDTLPLFDYFDYLNISQDYKKANEVISKYEGKYISSEILYKRILSGKFSEPFPEYQKNVGQFISNFNKYASEYENKMALSDLAQRIAKEELYPDYKYKPQNIKIDFWIKYSDNSTSVGGSRKEEINSWDDPTKRMFIEFDLMKKLRMKNYFYDGYDNNKKLIELDKYIEAVSNVYEKLILEYGEPLTN